MHIKNITTDEYHFFLTDEFSQWYPSKFKDERGIIFNCCEQYMMYCKAQLFGDKEVQAAVLATNDPGDMKKLGRQIKNFDQEVWNDNAYDIVTRGNVMKFSQNPELWDILNKTNNKVIVEAADYDTIWGIGLKAQDAVNTTEQQWLGTNLLGQAIMETRDFLRDMPHLIVEQPLLEKRVFAFYDAIGQKTIRLNSMEMCEQLQCTGGELPQKLEELTQELTIDFKPFVKEGMVAHKESLLQSVQELHTPKSRFRI